MFSHSFCLKSRNIKYFSYKALLLAILLKRHKIHTSKKKSFIHSASRLLQFVFFLEMDSLLLHVYIAEV